MGDGTARRGDDVTPTEEGLHRRVSEAQVVDGQGGQAEALIGAAPVGICVVDEDGTFAQVNDAYAALLGYRPDELVGRPFSVVVAPEALGRGMSTYRRAVASGAPLVLEHTLRRKDGTPVTLLGTGIPVVGPDGRPQRAVFAVDIDERKRAEEAQERLAAIVESTSDAIIGEAPDHTITSWNPGAERLYGYTAAEAVGRSIGMLAVPGGPDAEALIRAALLRGERIVDLDTVRRRKDGSAVAVSISVSPVRDGSGAVIGAAAIHRDIGERKALEGELRASEARFRSVFEHAPIGLVQVDLQGRILAANAAVQRVLGYEEDELRRLRFVDVTHPDDVAADWALFEAVLAGTRDSYTIDKRYIHKDGRVVWGRLAVSATRDERGEPQSIIGMLLDVTERRAAEEQSRFQAHLLDAVGQATIATDLEGRVTYWSRAAEALYGWRASEALGQSVMLVVPADVRDVDAAEIMAAVREGGTWLGEFEVQARDGRRFSVLETLAPVRDQGGAVVGMVGVSTDVTERKRAEEALARANTELARANAELETMFRVLPIGIGIAEDPAVSRIRMNPASAQMLGLPLDANASLSAPEGERPTNVRIYQGGRELTAEELPFEVAATGREVRDMEVEVVRADGARLTELAYAAPLRDEGGQVRGVVGAYLDISARVEAERQRDLLLAGLAHDLKNPLAGLVWLAEILQREVAGPDQGEILGSFVEGARQMMRQVNELVDTARGQIGRPLGLVLRRVDLAELVARLAAEQAQLHPDRRIVVEGAQEPLAGLYDEARLVRAVANVLGNAVKYSARGGEVTVALSRAEEGSGTWAVIRVADRGIGIPAAEVGRVFEPHYRASNARGKEGSGLGLAGARQVAEAHGGSVELASEEGAGTAVTIRLPLRPPGLPGAAEKARQAPRQRRRRPMGRPSRG